MQKTAMQQAIDGADILPLDQHAIQVFKDYLTSLLPTEREQIEGAYNDGYDDGADEGHYNDGQYFTNTFKND